MNMKRRGFPFNLFGGGGLFGNRGQGESFNPADLEGLGDFPGLGFEIDDLFDEMPDNAQQSVVGLPWQIAVARFSDGFNGAVIAFPRTEVMVNLRRGLISGYNTIQFVVAPSRTSSSWEVYLFVGDESEVTEDITRLVGGRIVGLSQLAGLLAALPYVDDNVILTASALFNREREANVATADMLGITSEALLSFVTNVPDGLVEAYLKRKNAHRNDTIDIQQAVNDGKIAFSEELARHGIITAEAYTSAMAPFATAFDAYCAHRKWASNDVRHQGLKHSLVQLATLTVDPGIALAAAWTVLWAENHIPEELTTALRMGAEVIPGLENVGEQIVASLTKQMALRVEAEMIAIWYEGFTAESVDGGFRVPMLVSDIVDGAMKVVERRLIDLIM